MIKKFVVVALLLTGCSPIPYYRSLSVGRVPCEAQHVQIASHETTGSSNRWVAVCQGRRYQCARSMSGLLSTSTACAELPTEQASERSQPR